MDSDELKYCLDDAGYIGGGAAHPNSAVLVRGSEAIVKLSQRQHEELSSEVSC